MKYGLPLFLTVFFLLSSQAGFAEELLKAPEPPTRFELYLKDTDKKFDRGALNFVAGWTEFVRQPIDHYKNPGQKNRWANATQGAGVGLVYGLADITGGFFNALTAVFPSWEIPLPEDGIKAEKITGGNSEVFPNEEETQSLSGSSVQSSSLNY